MVDRIIRVVFAVALVAFSVSTGRSWIGLLALIPLLTGLVGYCPLYRVLGIRTCPLNK